MMSNEQLATMLYRRGYLLVRITDTPSGATLFGCSGNRRRLLMQASELTTLTIEQVSLRIDIQLGWGQHHMQCVCGEPILRIVASSHPRIGSGTTCWYQYRAVAAGPGSAPISACPRCQSMIDIGTTREINDE